MGIFVRVGSVVALLVLAGCNETEIEDPGLRTSGAVLGKAAVALMTAPVSTDGPGMRDRLGAVEAELARLALGYDALGRGEGVAAQELVEPVKATGGPDAISWNGRRLEASLDSFGPGDTRLAADLRYEGYRRETLSPGSDGGWGGERGSDGSVQCPAIILQTLRFTRPRDGLTVHARFGVTLDGQGCAAGGQVAIDYAIRRAGEARGARLQSSYNGCGRIRILVPD